jgi:hypothetical protein
MGILRDAIDRHARATAPINDDDPRTTRQQLTDKISAVMAGEMKDDPTPEPIDEADLIAEVRANMQAREDRRRGALDELAKGFGKDTVRSREDAERSEARQAETEAMREHIRAITEPSDAISDSAAT